MQWHSPFADPYGIVIQPKDKKKEHLMKWRVARVGKSRQTSNGLKTLDPSGPLLDRWRTQRHAGGAGANEKMGATRNVDRDQVDAVFCVSL